MYEDFQLATLATIAHLKPPARVCPFLLSASVRLCAHAHGEGGVLALRVV